MIDVSDWRVGAGRVGAVIGPEGMVVGVPVATLLVRGESRAGSFATGGYGEAGSVAGARSAGADELVPVPLLLGAAPVTVGFVPFMDGSGGESARCAMLKREASGVGLFSLVSSAEPSVSGSWLASSPACAELWRERVPERTLFDFEASPLATGDATSLTASRFKGS